MELGTGTPTAVATPGELVKCIAEALNIPEPTVIQYDRLLAESGFRTKGGRGLSAAKVTAEDAANLLIAILGAPVAGASIKPAIETCQTYGELRLRLVQNDINDFRKIGLPTLAKLSKSHTLRDGIVASIEALRAGESLTFPADPEEGFNEPLTGPETDWHSEITLQGPTPWAGINFGRFEIDESYLVHLVYHRGKRDRRGHWVHHDSGDLHQSRTITFKTIRRIAELLGRDRR
jgi:hypothetical protein